MPLAKITMRKSIHGFPLTAYIGIGLEVPLIQLLILFTILLIQNDHFLHFQYLVLRTLLTIQYSYLRYLQHHT